MSMHRMNLLLDRWTGLVAPEDITAVDAALYAGYYPGHSEALPLVVVAIALLVLLHWALQASQKARQR